MSYTMIKDMHVHPDNSKYKIGIRIRRKFKTKRTIGRRRFERFVDSEFLVSAPDAYYKEFLNMKEEDAKRIKKQVIIIEKCITTTYSNINDILVKHNLTGSEIVSFFNVLRTCTETCIELSSNIEMSEISYTYDRDNLLFHLLLNFNDAKVREIYSCHYSRSQNNLIIQSNDMASRAYYKR